MKTKELYDRACVQIDAQAEHIGELMKEITEKDSIICNLRSDIKDLEDGQDELNETNRQLYGTNVELEAENAKLRKSREKLAGVNVSHAVLEHIKTGEPKDFGWVGQDSSKYYKKKTEAIQSWIEWSEEEE